jgi:SAM-dependent methyltransferase
LADYTASTYGDRIALEYDALYGGMFDIEATVGTLAELAGKGPALELGVGTGRIALPLAARGVAVHGIDASEAMVAQLRAKPGGAEVPVTMGDFADAPVEGEFSLVYVVFNTFFGLLVQDDQVRCFQNVARRLAPDGVFVIEAFVPDLTRFVRGQNTSTSRVELDRVVIDVSQHDPVNQRVMSQHVFITASGILMYPAQIRYAWPAELDLMARLAGLRLRHRWAGWRREPFTAASTGHVSVYQRDGNADGRR